MTELAAAETIKHDNFSQIATNAALWLGLAQVTRICVTFFSTIVVARLIGPDQFGIVAMATPVLALLYLLQDFGLATGAITARSLSNEQSSALFWLNTAIGVMVALLIVVTAPLIGRFYGEARVGTALMLNAGALVISAAGIQHSAVLSRQMRFARQGQAEMANWLITFVATVGLSLFDHSYQPLVLGPMVGMLAQTAVVWRFSGLQPGRPNFAASRDFLRVGKHLTGFALLNYLVRNVDNILIGRYWGPAPAGLYDRSYRLMMMPLQNINGPVLRVLEPMMAALRDDPGRYRNSFTYSAFGVMLANGPGVLVATAFSWRMMPWLLGERWIDAGAIFFWLGLAGLLQPVANLTSVLFITTSRTGQMVRWGAFSAVVTLAGFAIGIRWGAIGISQAFFATLALRQPLLFAWSTRDTPIAARTLWSAQLLPLIGPALVIVLAFQLPGKVPFLALFLGTVALAYPAAIATACISPSGRATVGRIGKQLASRLRAPGLRRRSNAG